VTETGVAVSKKHQGLGYHLRVVFPKVFSTAFFHTYKIAVIGAGMWTSQRDDLTTDPQQIPRCFLEETISLKLRESQNPHIVVKR